MSVEAPENTAEDLTDDALYADDPPDPGETAGGEGEDFAPYGYTTDRETGERRAKKRPGRPRKPPGPDELRAGDPPPPPPQDLPPGPKRKAPAADVPMPKGGTIARGVNRLYRRAGKIVRAMDHDIGTAIIECTHAEEAGDLTVGEAWENLAKANPRIRRFLLNALRGGDWWDLVMAHAPIGIALAMKPAVQRMLPFGRLAESMLEVDEDTQPGDLRPADAVEMQKVAEAQAAKIAARMGAKVPQHVVAAAARQAGAVAAGMGITPQYEEHDLSHPDGVPPGLRRSQPRNRSRAARRGR